MTVTRCGRCGRILPPAALNQPSKFDVCSIQCALEAGVSEATLQALVKAGRPEKPA